MRGDRRDFARMHNEYLDPDRHLWDGEPPEGLEFSHETDPYHYLTWCIGSADDFWCFDFATCEETRTIRLHAVINSETGGFIMNAEEPTEVGFAEGVKKAQRLVDSAIDWCFDNEVTPDWDGWKTSEGAFVKAVSEAIEAA